MFFGARPAFFWFCNFCEVQLEDQVFFLTLLPQPRRRPALLAAPGVIETVVHKAMREDEEVEVVGEDVVDTTVDARGNVLLLTASLATRLSKVFPTPRLGNLNPSPRR